MSLSKLVAAKYRYIVGTAWEGLAREHLFNWPVVVKPVDWALLAAAHAMQTHYPFLLLAVYSLINLIIGQANGGEPISHTIPIAAEDLLRELLESAGTTDSVVDLLRLTGYPQAHVLVTRSKDTSTEIEATPEDTVPGAESPQDIYKHTVAHSCHPLPMLHSTISTLQERANGDVPAMEHGNNIAESNLNFGNNLNFLQTADKIWGKVGGETVASYSMDPKDRGADLACECQPYECHCRKQCFCRLAADPFRGMHYPPEANCPVCPVCFDSPDAGNPGNDATEQAPDDVTVEQDYKCTCSFEGIGGAGISNGGFMECDCKVADCTCDKKCVCRKGLPMAARSGTSGNHGSGRRSDRDSSTKQKSSQSSTTGGSNRVGEDKKLDRASGRSVESDGSAVPAICCKFRDAERRGGGNHYVWLTQHADVRSCQFGSYGGRSRIVLPGSESVAPGLDVATEEGCRRISLSGGEDIDQFSRMGDWWTKLNGACCVYENKEHKEAVGMNYAWLTNPTDLFACGKGEFRGRSYVVDPRSKNPAGESYGKKSGCVDMLHPTPLPSSKFDTGAHVSNALRKQ